MDISIRAITTAEAAAFDRGIAQAFGHDPAEDGARRLVDHLDLSRTYAAFDGDEMVATSGAFSFNLTIPGGVADMGGLTMVSVRPTHRRQGILRRMIEAHFEDAAGRGEPLSGLWASEAPIYGRFGYGSAVTRHNLKINAPGARFADYTGGDVVRLAALAEAQDVVPEIYERRRLDRSGMLSRSEAWWRARHFRDEPRERRSWSERRYAVSYRNGVPVGYLVYRQKGAWEGWQPRGTVKIEELVGDVEAQSALWAHATSIDLFPNIEWWNAPADDPIEWRAANPRAVEQSLGDSLWLRILDVPEALTARRYRTTDRLAIGLSDGTTFELDIDDAGEAGCSLTDRPADVRCDVGVLGSLYLGGRSAIQMAAAGLIDGDPGDVRRLDELMAWDAPWCPEVF